MKKTLITLEQFKIMPWKNKAGVTAEIAIQPEDADFSENNFEWRLSSAHIQDENSFSKFAGYDRLLTVLSGDGLILNGEELAPFNVFAFKGEEDITCSLVDSPVEDLGIIYRRDKYMATMQVLELTKELSLPLGSGVHFFMTIAHPVVIDGTELQTPSFLKIENATTVQIKAEDYPTYLLKITIDQKHLLQ